MLRHCLAESCDRERVPLLIILTEIVAIPGGVVTPKTAAGAVAAALQKAPHAKPPVE
jgi:hypothetical protein